MAVLLAVIVLMVPVDLDERLLSVWKLLVALPGHSTSFADIVERRGVRLMIGPEPPIGGAMYLPEPPRRETASRPSPRGSTALRCPAQPAPRRLQNAR